MDYHMHWRHVVTCCRVMCAYYAYVTIRRALGVACFGSRHFVNTVSGQHFSAENKQEAAEFDSQHLPMHFRGVIWKIKSKSNFPVSFSLINAEMNLVGNYRTLRGLRTVNPEGLPSTSRFPLCPCKIFQTWCVVTTILLYLKNNYFFLKPYFRICDIFYACFGFLISLT